MDGKRLITTIMLLTAFGPLAVACAASSTSYAPPQPVNVSAAEATYIAAAQAATAQARQEWAAVTAEAAQATAVAQSTRDTVTLTAEASVLRATTQALDESATRSAIASNATATAVAMAAQVEQRLVADEATRLAIQRERERVAIRNDELWAAIWPWLVGVSVVGLAALGIGVAHTLMQRTRPLVVDQGENRAPAVLIYSGGGYRQLAAPRITAVPNPDEPIALGAPMSETDLPALTSGHALVVGPTDAGKSTALRAIIKARLDAGQQVYVLDPHNQPGKWPGATVIGGGRAFDAIPEFMGWMIDQLNSRARAMARGETRFDPVTVATDEMPAIVDELERSVAVVWRKWVREGRKFGLFFVLSTQSTRVETLGIKGEGDVLQNFAAILYLGESAVGAYPHLAQSQERPAVLRTLRGARPVVVPHIQPEVTAVRHEPIAVAPEPAPAQDEPRDQVENVGLSTPYGFVSPAMIQQIVNLTKAGESGRAVERAVFGYDGGHAYNQRIAVLQVLLPDALPQNSL